MGVKGTARSSGPRPIPKTGLHKARLVWLIDEGTQESSFANEKKLIHKIKLCFELPEALHTFDEDKGPQPFMVSKEFTVSVGKKSNMRPFLEGWLGRELTAAEEKDGFDFSSLFAAPVKGCGMMNVIHKTDRKDAAIKYANIGSMSPMPQGSSMKKAINPIIDYAIGAPNQWEEFEKIYPALQEKIKKSPEWQSEAAKANYSGTTAAVAAGEEPEDEDAF